MYFVYIIYNESSDTFYIGHSNDPWKRLEQHNQNGSDKFTGKYHNWVLCAVFEAGNTRSSAMFLETFIKKQKSKALINPAHAGLIQPDFMPEGVLAQLPVCTGRMCGINQSPAHAGSSRGRPE
jgi:putative endonuclease